MTYEFEHHDRAELVEILIEADRTADSPTVFTVWDHAADKIIEAGFRKVFDGDCGLGTIQTRENRLAAEAWMRFANFVAANENGIAAMKQMLTEFGYLDTKEETE